MQTVVFECAPSANKWYLASSFITIITNNEVSFKRNTLHIEDLKSLKDLKHVVSLFMTKPKHLQKKRHD